MCGFIYQIGPGLANNFGNLKYLIRISLLAHPQVEAGTSQVWLLRCTHIGESLSPTVAYQAPLSMGFSRQEYWSGVPLPSPSLSPRSQDIDSKTQRLSLLLLSPTRI